jgi:hypothetical protein
MATTSGTYAFQLEVAEVIAEAYERCGKLAEVLSGPQLRSARRSLNLIQSEWANRGVNLWKVSLLSLALVQGQGPYPLPAETIAILDAYRSQANSGDILLTRISRSDYAAIPMKSRAGPPTSFYFERTIQPSVTLWPVPEASSTYTLNLHVISQQQDVSAAAQLIDIPYRWQEAICSALAARMAGKYAPERKADLGAEAERAFLLAQAEDHERAPLRIIPGIGGY